MQSSFNLTSLITLILIIFCFSSLSAVLITGCGEEGGGTPYPGNNTNSNNNTDDASSQSNSGNKMDEASKATKAISGGNFADYIGAGVRGKDKAGNMNNLKQIYNAILIYSQVNDGRYPAYHRVVSGEKATAIGFQAEARGGKGMTEADINKAALTNNISAALWLLVRDGHATPNVFANPALNGDKPDTLEPGARVSELWDFKSSNNFSYSFINMYDKIAGMKWGIGASSSYVLAADDNDSSDLKGNSSNMRDEGQHALFGDGHVDWATSPMIAFGKEDNVYTYQSDAGESKANAASTAGKTVSRSNMNSDVFLIPIDVLAN